MQLLHGDSRLHLIFRLRHSLHALHCHQSVDMDQYRVLGKRVHGWSSSSACRLGHGERVAGRWVFLQNKQRDTFQYLAASRHHLKIFKKIVQKGKKEKTIEIDARIARLSAGGRELRLWSVWPPISRLRVRHPNGGYSQMVSATRPTINKHTSTRINSSEQAGSSLPELPLGLPCQAQDFFDKISVIHFHLAHEPSLIYIQ